MKAEMDDTTTRDVMKRRRTPKLSGFRQHLLQSSWDTLGNDRTIDTQLDFSSYQPPPSTKSLQHSNNQNHNEDYLLFLSTPTPTSAIREFQPPNPNQNPPYDLGSNSLFSYGCCCCRCVRTTEIGVVENFGRFESLLQPGFHCIPWPLTDITGRLSLVSIL